MKSTRINLRKDQYLELEKLGLGVFSPVVDFMSEEDFQSVTENLRLKNGILFPLPIFLDITDHEFKDVINSSIIELFYHNKKVGELKPESIFKCNKLDVAVKIFGTNSLEHPGVKRFLMSGEWFVGGETQFLERISFDYHELEKSPEETKKIFKELGWKKIVGFQTRNVPHRAHEYLQKVALEQVDGIFIQPLIGQKKIGDYTPEAIITGYQVLIENYFPKARVQLGVLTTSMRYAGPREAIFHAIIRRNYGCTHFIIGRDHAGVGNFYGKYEAHNLTKLYENELGISIMYLSGPFFCFECGSVTTEKTCPHFENSPEQIYEISGTLIRKVLSEGSYLDPLFMRPLVVNSVKNKELFIEKEE